ncbi:MAG: hypothetical protein LBF93_02845 [Zoogloeaceae bacterium]|jgi:hypothetical protein|nr:hypothetical protein [Zoogloeaceae bacterium]
MDTITQLQTPMSSGLISSIGQGNAPIDGKNPPRAENVAQVPLPVSTRVTLSVEGQNRLAAEQAVAANPFAGPTVREPANAQPVTPTIAAATLASAPSAAIGQGATQAAASPVTPTAATPSVPASAASATEAVNAAQPAAPEPGNPIRQETERAANQEDNRENDAAAARQDAGPVLTQSANTTRNALSA